jgi:hypothetical protein
LTDKKDWPSGGMGMFALDSDNLLRSRLIFIFLFYLSNTTRRKRELRHYGFEFLFNFLALFPTNENGSLCFLHTHQK